MPTVKLDLGRFVTVRHRKDGTARVLFEVPPRLRPSGWSATIPLPIEGRAGNLKDASEVARIKADAEALYKRLHRDRRGIASPRGRTLQNLIDAWQDSDEWKALKPKSVKHYDVYIRCVQAWSEAAGHPDPTHIRPNDVTAFLKLFDAQPVTKKNVLKALRLIFRQAVLLDWRQDNPTRELRATVPTTKVAIWEQADVDAYAAEAVRQGRHSLALIIRMEWEIGQRLTDVREFRPGVEYDPAGIFRFNQSKTGNAVSIPVSNELRDLLNAAGKGELFMFRNDITGSAFTDHALSHAFDKVRRRVLKAGGRHLLLRCLRHSCVVQLARGGCTVPEIASVTGHSPASAAQIIAHYLPRDSAVATAAQTKRGLIGEQSGTKSLTAVKLSEVPQV